MDKLLKPDCDQQQSISSLDSQLKFVNENKFKEFELRWSKFNDVINESISNEKNKDSINYLLNGDTNSLELNGLDFINGLKQEGQNKLNLDEDILNLVFENNDALRNVILFNNFSSIKMHFEI